MIKRHHVGNIDVPITKGKETIECTLELPKKFEEDEDDFYFHCSKKNVINVNFNKFDLVEDDKVDAIFEIKPLNEDSDIQFDIVFCSLSDTEYDEIHDVEFGSMDVHYRKIFNIDTRSTATRL